MQIWLLCSVAALSVLAGTSRAQECSVSFLVTTEHLSCGDRVFITGNHDKLGRWDPGAVPLERRGEDRWAITLSFEPGTRLEYKFTIGSWDTEALQADGKVPPNAVLQVGDNTTVEVNIPRWRRPAAESSDARYTGTVDHLHGFEGEGILPRDVLVWLPPSYPHDDHRRYPVLYMHDGQQVFDPATSTWGVDWGVDETATRLITEGQMREIIVVAVYCTADRRPEYSETPQGAAYRRFIVEKLKPFIDSSYRTLADRENTAVMGSSMGGRVSFLLAWDYPEVFSMAGCLSPSFEKETFDRVPPAGGSVPDVRFYMDNGGQGLDEQLQAGAATMLSMLEDLGFEQGRNLVWFRDPQADHNEAAWARRVWMPLLYFFGVGPQAWIRDLPPVPLPSSETVVEDEHGPDR